MSCIIELLSGRFLHFFCLVYMEFWHLAVLGLKLHQLGYYNFLWFCIWWFPLICFLQILPLQFYWCDFESFCKYATNVFSFITLWRLTKNIIDRNLIPWTQIEKLMLHLNEKEKKLGIFYVQIAGSYFKNHIHFLKENIIQVLESLQRLYCDFNLWLTFYWDFIINDL